MVSMADSPNTPPLSVEALNELATRLFDHADSITNPAARNIEVDMRLAARSITDFATLRFGITQAAASCSDAATARHLHELLRGR
jgi:hypothetical protein